MIVYLLPTVFIMTLVAAAAHARRQIEPACPACSARVWQETPVVLQCGACGWSTVTRSVAEVERQVA